MDNLKNCWRPATTSPADEIRTAKRKRMTIDDLQIGPQNLAEYLRSARPHLICRVEPQGTPYIRYFEPADEVISEGYDPDHSPLGCSVYWRIVNRGNEQIYCSTFLATRDQVIKVWGTKGLVYCDHITRMAVARIETILTPRVAVRR